ncbi:MAG TPA: hypothetical protein VE129_13160, partial [Thermoanaerobaculia bacterium]|nr:hypothetical protein [Thermoanaerobaculia bacterium]
MKRTCLVPALVALAAVTLSLPAAGAGGSRLPEAAPLPVPQAAVQEAPVVEFLPTDRNSMAKPFPVGWEDDVYCAGWIGETTEPVVGSIVAAEYEDSRHMYGVGDIVYSDVGAREGLAAGQEFWVIRPGHEVYRVGSITDTLGRFYHTPARMKVVCVQETTAILEITESCEPSFIGDLMIPFEPIPIPLVRASAPFTQCDAPSGKVTGHIVEVKDRATPVGTDSVVFLDLGEEDGLYPGDFLTVFRKRNDSGTIRTLLGEAAVLWTKGRTCVAKVTSMVDYMGAGDL